MTNLGPFWEACNFQDLDQLRAQLKAQLRAQLRAQLSARKLSCRSVVPYITAHMCCFNDANGLDSDESNTAQ